MVSPSVSVIVIDTGFREKFGLKSIRGGIKPEKLLDALHSIYADYYIVLPDILYPYQDFAKRILNKYKDRDLIILKGKPKSIMARLLHSLAYNPLSEFTGDNLGLAVIISRRLVVKAWKARSLKELVEAASYITKLVYREPVSDYIYMVYGRLPKSLIITLLEPLRMIKFALVGLSGILINLAAITLSLSLFHSSFQYVYGVLIASIIGFELSLTWNFILHELWTFRDLKLDHSIDEILKRWLKYHLGSLGSLITQTGTITLLSGYMGTPLYQSVLVGVFLGFIVNYLVGRLYTWTE